ncbi:MAG: synthase subunit alpha, partial [Patescibacteria group bacterium]|nr:synthase subunit alpha [Patescibacteria group bacterium]
MNDSIVDKLKKEIAGVSVGVKQEIVGRIVEVGDGIAKASGLSQVKSQEMLNIETAHGTVSG